MAAAVADEDGWSVVVNKKNKGIGPVDPRNEDLVEACNRVLKKIPEYARESIRTRVNKDKVYITLWLPEAATDKLANNVILSLSANTGILGISVTGFKVKRHNSSKFSMEAINSLCTLILCSAVWFYWPLHIRFSDDEVTFPMLLAPPRRCRDNRISACYRILDPLKVIAVEEKKEDTKEEETPSDVTEDMSLIPTDTTSSWADESTKLSSVEIFYRDALKLMGEGWKDDGIIHGNTRRYYHKYSEVYSKNAVTLMIDYVERMESIVNRRMTWINSS